MTREDLLENPAPNYVCNIPVSTCKEQGEDQTSAGVWFRDTEDKTRGRAGVRTEGAGEGSSLRRRLRRPARRRNMCFCALTFHLRIEE